MRKARVCTTGLPAGPRTTGEECADRAVPSLRGGRKAGTADKHIWTFASSVTSSHAPHRWWCPPCRGCRVAVTRGAPPGRRHTGGGPPERFAVTRGPATPWLTSDFQPIESIRITPPARGSGSALTDDYHDLVSGAVPPSRCLPAGAIRATSRSTMMSRAARWRPGAGIPNALTFRGVLEHARDGDGWSSRGMRSLSRHRVSELRAGAVQATTGRALASLAM